MRRRPEAILIAGPTASGKSALALRVAARFGGRIINTDSMQVYRDLRVLTARPTEADMARVPHALYGTIDGAKTHSVSLWLVDARAELARSKQDEVLPIFVGGTGLYFQALTQGLSAIPPIPDKVRSEIRIWAEGRAPTALHQELARRDPVTAARLRSTDPQRILRALEVHEATGESLTCFHARREHPVVDIGDCIAIALTVDREVLRPRIDARFDAMVADSGLDEVERLKERNLDYALPVMRAIGVPPLLRHLAGALSLKAAIAEAKTASRQYIKRQETFVRHQLLTFRAVPAGDAEALLTAMCQSL